MKKAAADRKKATKLTTAARTAAKKGDKVSSTKLYVAAAKKRAAAKSSTKKAVRILTVQKKKKVVRKAAPVRVTVKKAITVAKPVVKDAATIARENKVKTKVDIKAITVDFKAGMKKRHNRVPHTVTAALGDAIDQQMGILTEEDIAEVHKKLQKIADANGDITADDVINAGQELQADFDRRAGATGAATAKASI